MNKSYTQWKKSLRFSRCKKKHKGKTAYRAYMRERSREQRKAKAFLKTIGLRWEMLQKNDSLNVVVAREFLFYDKNKNILRNSRLLYMYKKPSAVYNSDG